MEKVVITHKRQLSPHIGQSMDLDTFLDVLVREARHPFFVMTRTGLQIALLTAKAKVLGTHGR